MCYLSLFFTECVHRESCVCLVERRGSSEGPAGLGHQSEETSRTKRDLPGRRPLSHQPQRERGVARPLEEREGQRDSRSTLQLFTLIQNLTVCDVYYIDVSWASIVVFHYYCF